MASTIDTSDGKIVLNGGAVALPTSATSVTSPVAGSVRYNSTTDAVEWYSGTGTPAWYTVGAVALKGVQTITADTTLTQANFGYLLLLNKSTTLNLTLPAANTVKAGTGFVADAQASFVTFHTAGTDVMGAGTTYTMPKGAHISVVSNGSNEWIIFSDHNPYATVTPWVFESVAAAVTAAGTNQSTATAIAAKYNIVTTVASGTGVKLPLFNNIGVGVEIYVYNNGANSLAVYPPSGGVINALATNAAYTVRVGDKVRFISSTTTNWIVDTVPVANNTIMSNISGGSAVPIANSVTSVLDTIGNAEGSMLYRGASSWLALTPGTTYQFLQSLGPGATPQWANAVTAVNTGTGLTGGPITGSGTISFAAIGNSTMLANITGGSSPPSATTLTAFIDDAISNTQGVILYRGASSWSALTPGTSGQFLQTGGASANPSWASLTTATTAAVGDNSTNIATTAFVTTAVDGVSSVSTTGGSTTLTAAQYGVPIILVTGTLASNATLVVPNNGKWTISNRTTGAFTVTVQTSGGTGVTVTQGANSTIVADGTNVVLAYTDYPTLTLTGAVTGTGTTSITTSYASVANNSILANISGSSGAPSANTLTAIIDSALGNTQGDILYRDTAAWQVLAPGTAGNYLKTGGAAANPTWGAVSSGDVTTALGYTPVATNSRFTDYAFWGTNSGATAGRLTTDGSAASGTNVGALANNSAAIFDIELIAYDTVTAAAVTYTLSGGLITRGANAAATAIVGSPTFSAGTTTVGAPTIGTAPTVAADTTNGGFDIEFTPPAANTDAWHITARVRVTLVS